MDNSSNNTNDNTANNKSNSVNILQEDKKPSQEQQNHQWEKTGQAAAAATIAAGVAATATTVGEGAKQEDMHKYWDHILKGPNDNKSFTAKTIFVAHNSGTEPGSGVIIPAQNQDHSISYILDNTPVRGLELDTWKHNGEICINHGGYFDPTVANPKTFSSALDEIKGFLDKPENADQVILVRWENRLDSSEDIDKALGILQGKFGSSICTLQDFKEMSGDNPDNIPTTREMAAMGKRIVVIADRIRGLQPNDAAISHHDYFTYLNRAPYEIVEDRTMVGEAVYGVHPDVAKEITTEDVDKMVQSGGFVKIDRINPYDPRFLKPEDRIKFTAKPNVKILGFIEIPQGTASTVLFGSHITSTTLSGAIAIATGIYQAVANYKYINNADQQLMDMVPKIDLITAAEILQKQKLGNIPLTKQDLQKFCADDMIKKITINTISPGLSSSVALASAIFSISILVPPLAPVFAITAIAVASTGLVVTAIATYVNRQKLKQHIKEALQTEKLDKLLDAQTTELNKNLEDYNAGKDQAMELKKSWLSRFSNMGVKILFFNTLTRITAFGKYAIPVLSKVSAITLSVFSVINVAVSAFTNYKERDEKYKHISQLTTALLAPSLFEKKYPLFGSTNLEKFAKKTYGLSKSELANISKQDPEKYQHIQQEYIVSSHKENLQKFCKAHKPPLTDKPEDEQIKEYIKYKVASYVKQDTVNSGMINTMKLSISLGAIATVVPPALPILIGAALVTGVIGYGVSRLVAIYEQKKFTKKLDAIFDYGKTGAIELNTNNPEIPVTIRQKANQMEFEKLSSLVEAYQAVLHHNSGGVKEAAKEPPSDKEQAREKVVTRARAVAIAATAISVAEVRTEQTVREKAESQSQNKGAENNNKSQVAKMGKWQDTIKKTDQSHSEIKR